MDVRVCLYMSEYSQELWLSKSETSIRSLPERQCYITLGSAEKTLHRAAMIACSPCVCADLVCCHIRLLYNDHICLWSARAQLCICYRLCACFHNQVIHCFFTMFLISCREDIIFSHTHTSVHVFLEQRPINALTYKHFFSALSSRRIMALL